MYIYLYLYSCSYRYIPLISTVSNTIPLGYSRSEAAPTHSTIPSKSKSKSKHKSIHFRGMDPNKNSHSQYTHVSFQHLCSSMPCGLSKSKTKSKSKIL